MCLQRLTCVVKSVEDIVLVTLHDHYQEHIRMVASYPGPFEKSEMGLGTRLIRMGDLSKSV